MDKILKAISVGRNYQTNGMVLPKSRLKSDQVTMEELDIEVRKSLQPSSTHMWIKFQEAWGILTLEILKKPISRIFRLWLLL